MRGNDIIRSVCWYCSSINSLCWNSDFNYDEVYGEGEGVVTFLHCMNCKAEIQYSLRTDELEDEEIDTEDELN